MMSQGALKIQISYSFEMNYLCMSQVDDLCEYKKELLHFSLQPRTIEWKYHFNK